MTSIQIFSVVKYRNARVCLLLQYTVTKPTSPALVESRVPRRNACSAMNFMSRQTQRREMEPAPDAQVTGPRWGGYCREERRHTQVQRIGARLRWGSETIHL